MAEIRGFACLARLMLEERGMVLTGRGSKMRRFELIAVSLLWLALATLMPMAALEPVQAAGTSTAAAVLQ